MPRQSGDFEEDDVNKSKATPVLETPGLRRH
jgi:hypothetical protein